MFSAYKNNLFYSRHIALYCPGNHLTSIRYSVVSLSKKNEMGGACGAYGGGESGVQGFCGES